MPFHLDGEAAAALDSFKSGAASLVEVVVAPGETLKLAQGALALKAGDSVKDALAALDAPRFVLARAGAAPHASTGVERQHAQTQQTVLSTCS